MEKKRLLAHISFPPNLQYVEDFVLKREMKPGWLLKNFVAQSKSCDVASSRNIVLSVTAVINQKKKKKSVRHCPDRCHSARRVLKGPSLHFFVIW